MEREMRIGDEIVLYDRGSGEEWPRLYIVTKLDPLRAHNQEIYEEYRVTDMVMECPFTAYRLSDRQKREDRLREIGIAD